MKNLIVQGMSDIRTAKNDGTPLNTPVRDLFLSVSEDGKPSMGREFKVSIWKNVHQSFFGPQAESKIGQSFDGYVAKDVPCIPFKGSDGVVISKRSVVVLNDLHSSPEEAYAASLNSAQKAEYVAILQELELNPIP